MTAVGVIGPLAVGLAVLFVLWCWREERRSARRYRAHEDAHRAWQADPTNVEKYQAFLRSCRR